MSDSRSICREFVKKHSASNDASHDISHIDRVVTNAIKIWSMSDARTQELVDQNVLIAIASFHDSFDHKYFTTESAVLEAKSHVMTFLDQACKYAPAVIEMIIKVIENMGYTAEVTCEKKVSFTHSEIEYLSIVQDADRLDAIGAVGISRCLAFSGAFGRPIITESGLDESEQRRNFSDGTLQASARKGPSAISHFYDKLVFLKGMLKTEAGKILGEKRHDFILRFLDQFFDEING